MLLSRRFFPACLIGLLLFTGMAQAQNSPGGANPLSPELKSDAGNYLQPWQPSLNADQDAMKKPLQEQRPHSSKTVYVPLINQPNSQDKTKKATEAKNSGQGSGLLKPSFKHNRESTAQNMGPQASGVARLATSRGSMQSPAPCASFLDGYLLKSLHDKGIGRKRISNEKESKDDLPQKKAKKAY